MTRCTVILSFLLLASSAAAQNIAAISAGFMGTMSAGYVPTDGLIGMYEARSVGTYGIQVTNFYDLSGMGNHAIALAGSPATPIVSNYAGRTSIYFDGGDYFSFLSPFYTSNQTVVAVFTRPSTTSASVIIGSRNTRPLPLYWAANNQFIYAGFTAIGRATAANTTTGLVCVATACANGDTNTITVILNGTQLATPNALSSGTYGQVSRIGSYANENHIGHLIALYIYNRKYSAAELVPLFIYINDNWSVYL